MIEYIWRKANTFEGLQPIRQVYGACFDLDGNLLIFRQKDKPWNIPGGRPEAGETPRQTLIREVYEETTVHIGMNEMIGYQEVWEDGVFLYHQLRFAALIDRIDQQQPDPDKGVIHERRFIPAHKATEFVTYPNYIPMFEAAIEWYKKQKKDG